MRFIVFSFCLIVLNGCTNNGKTITMAMEELSSSDRIVIYNGFITLETNRPDSILSKTQDIAKTFGGYTASSKNNQVILRIPVAKLNECMDAVARLGHLYDRGLTTTDVTEQYRDLKIRLDNAEKARQRYLELLAKAETVEAALKVEKELERLNTELDLLKSQIQHIEKDVQFSYLAVNIHNRVRPGPVGYIFYYAYKAVSWLLVWD